MSEIPQDAPPWLRNMLERLHTVFSVAVEAKAIAHEAKRASGRMASIDRQLGELLGELGGVRRELGKRLQHVEASLDCINDTLGREMSERRDEDLAQRRELGALQRRVLTKHGGAGAAAGGAVVALLELAGWIVEKLAG